jgi:hypothetical protein
MRKALKALKLFIVHLIYVIFNFMFFRCGVGARTGAGF